jgi:hypothetical protein
VDFVFITGSDIKQVIGRREQERPGSTKFVCWKQPGSKGFVEIPMKIGERVKEPEPYCPGRFVWTFLVDFLKFSLALALEVDIMADAWCQTITRGIGHIREGKDLEIETTVVDLADCGGGEASE